jgi:hypothetical protein
MFWLHTILIEMHTVLKTLNIEVFIIFFEFTEKKNVEDGLKNKFARYICILYGILTSSILNKMSYFFFYSSFVCIRIFFFKLVNLKTKLKSNQNFNMIFKTGNKVNFLNFEKCN